MLWKAWWRLRKARLRETRVEARLAHSTHGAVAVVRQLAAFVHVMLDGPREANHVDRARLEIDVEGVELRGTVRDLRILIEDDLTGVLVDALGDGDPLAAGGAAVDEPVVTRAEQDHGQVRPRGDSHHARGHCDGNAYVSIAALVAMLAVIVYAFLVDRLGRGFLNKPDGLDDKMTAPIGRGS